MSSDASIPPSRVLVVGANGFVGRRLVEALTREPRLQPVAAVRGHRRPAVAGVEVVQCDATDPTAMQQALAGIDYAVNCVAGNDAAMVAATNVLCDAARRSGLRRLVHLSSMAVYGGATGLVDEACIAVRPVSGYGMAKHACEQAVRDYIADGGTAVILRPGCIYGPGSEQWTGRIARLLRAGRLGDLGADGDGVCNLTYIDDLVAAIVLSLIRDEAADETFNIATSDPPDWNFYLTRFARALNATPVQRLSGRRLKLETKLGAPALRLAAIGTRLARLPIQVPDAITPSLATLFRHDIRLDVHKAAERLGLGETSLEWGLAASARWVAGLRPEPSAQQHDLVVEARQR
ncbi:MAG: NAD(P)-dependent oxidoreductase [Acetobacteraceae bacterium]|nr:NAD(P)-dependent oxidoreductase [Acetobacteraceae bacterium]